MSKAFVGMDLATTYCCVAVFIDGRPEVVEDDNGNKSFPSYIAFTQDENPERLVGLQAKQQATMNPKNTIYDSKRFIGRKFNDPAVQDLIKKVPFTVKADTKGNPIFVCQYKDQPLELSPEEVAAAFIQKMKQMAEKKLGYEVTEAVISVPAYFNNEQKEATKDAALIAGVKCLRIVQEPTAAALASGLSEGLTEGEKNIIVCDLGGGTYDVSLLVRADSIFEVRSLSGDTVFGGIDIDNRLSEFIVNEFCKKNKLSLEKEREFKTNERVRNRLLGHAENAKKALSFQLSSDVTIDSLFDGIDFNITITRAKYEELCSDIFLKVLPPIESALKDAKMDKKSVDDIVLVGGSTRIPKIQKLVKDFFNGKELKINVNPDTAIAEGACIQAAVILKAGTENISQLVVLDVCPLSLGIEIQGQMMHVIIPRNTTIPTRKSRSDFSTASDNQPMVTIAVYEGERKMTRDNRLLGKFELDGIPPMPRGKPEIEVTYEIDANCILTVTAKEVSTGKTKNITIQQEKNRFSEEELKAKIDEAERYAEEDKINIDRLSAKNELENYLYNTRNAMTDEFKAKVSPEDNVTIDTTIKNGLEWLEQNVGGSKDEYTQKLEEFMATLGPIFQKYYQQAESVEQPNVVAPQGHTVEDIDD